MSNRQHTSGRETREGPSQRQLRVGEEIRRVVSRAFERGEIHDPLLYETSLTISEVSVSPDMRQASVWFVPLGGGAEDEAQKDLQDALNRVAGYLSGIAARELHMKYAPRLIFKRDTGFDTSMRIDALLQDPRVRADVAAAQSDDDQDEPGQDEPGQDEHGQDEHGQDERGQDEHRDGPAGDKDGAA
jgi:ribosome-binding factor A